MTCSVHTFQVYTRFVGQRNTYTVDDARSQTLIVAVAVWASAARRLTALACEAASGAIAAAALHRACVFSLLACEGHEADGVGNQPEACFVAVEFFLLSCCCFLL